MTQRPLVAHVTTTDISLALLLGPQLRAFHEAGYDIVGISAPGPWVAELEEGGIRHVAMVHATRSMSPVEDLRALVELTRILRRLRPAVVHTHNPKPGVYGRLAAALTRVPVVVNTVHGLYAIPEDPLPKRAFVYALERLCSIASDAELVQNPEDLPVLRRIGVAEHKLLLLGNGVDLARFDPAVIEPAQRQRLRDELGIGSDDVVVGAVGRLVREKGYPELFEAAHALRRTHPEAVLVVVGPEEPEKGDGLSFEELEAAREDAGVRFLGLRHDVEALYAAMDVYVLASHREGIPRSAMEAAAMGLPLVVTDIRGGRQVVDEGVTGFLVPPRAPEALASAIGRLVEDESMRRDMGRASREKAVRGFDHRHQIELTLAVYERLLRDAPGAPR